MTTGTKTIVGLYHEADEALWQELQLHLNLLARQHPEYSWQSLPLPLHELSGEKLKDAALLVLGISVDFLNALYLEQHRLLATLKTLSQTCRGPWDSPIIAIRMRKTNWPPKDEQFLWYRILPAMQPCIAGRPQQRNDACVEVAIAIEQAIGHRQRIDARKPQEITEETKKARLEHELSAILGSLGVQLEGEQELPPALSPEAPMRPGALPPNKINQVWFCEQCHVVDAVQIAKTATYYEVVGAIQASHQAKAPHCNRTNGIAFARVINPAVVTSCKVLAAEVPTWAVEAIAQLMGFSSYQ